MITKKEREKKMESNWVKVESAVKNGAVVTKHVMKKPSKKSQSQSQSVYQHDNGKTEISKIGVNLKAYENASEMNKWISANISDDAKPYFHIINRDHINLYGIYAYGNDTEYGYKSPKYDLYYMLIPSSPGKADNLATLVELNMQYNETDKFAVKLSRDYQGRTGFDVEYKSVPSLKADSVFDLVRKLKDINIGKNRIAFLISSIPYQKAYSQEDINEIKKNFEREKREIREKLERIEYEQEKVDRLKDYGLVTKM